MPVKKDLQQAKISQWSQEVSPDQWLLL